tara:strand:- start:3716 stop:4234 length:519 start_codon:yes stop_codon:yes gene_type:complete
MSYEKEMRINQEGSIESQNLGLAHELSERSKEEKQDYFNRLIKTGVPKSTAQQLELMLTSDLTLSYLQKGGASELRWVSKIYKELVYAIHPNSESIMQGEYRSFLMDDPEDVLCALGAGEKLLISEVATIIETRIARSDMGWQQNELSKTIVVSETKRTGDPDEKKRKGLFR